MSGALACERPVATSRAPASSSAPNTRAIHCGGSSRENSPAAWPRSSSAISGSASTWLRRRDARGSAERVALRDIQPRRAQPAQRVGGAALVEPAGGERLLGVLDRLLPDRFHQRLARREVAVDAWRGRPRRRRPRRPCRRRGSRRAAAPRPRRCGGRCGRRRRGARPFTVAPKRDTDVLLDESVLNVHGAGGRLDHARRARACAVAPPQQRRAAAEQDRRDA